MPSWNGYKTHIFNIIFKDIKKCARIKAKPSIHISDRHTRQTRHDINTKGICTISVSLSAWKDQGKYGNKWWMDLWGNPSPLSPGCGCKRQSSTNSAPAKGSSRWRWWADQWAFGLTVTSLRLNQSASTLLRPAYKARAFTSFFTCGDFYPEECSTKSFGHYYFVFVCSHIKVL